MYLLSRKKVLVWILFLSFSLLSVTTSAAQIQNIFNTLNYNIDFIEKIELASIIGNSDDFFEKTEQIIIPSIVIEPQKVIYNEITDPKRVVYNEMTDPKKVVYNEMTDPKKVVYNEITDPQRVVYNEMTDPTNFAMIIK